MMLKSLARSVGGLAFGLTAFTLAHPATAQEAIGEVSEVKLAAYGTLPERGRVQLDLAETLYRDEMVETVPQGGLSVIFLDGTSFHLGGDSSAVLDEFIYDPDARGGKGLVELGTGVFRFVSGGQSADENLSFETANSIIGVRGTDFIIVSQPGADTIGTVSGLVEVTIQGHWDTVAIEPGNYASVDPATKSIELRTAPVRASDLACWLATQEDHVCKIVPRDPGSSGSAQAGHEKDDGRDAPSRDGPSASPANEPAGGGRRGSVSIGPRG